MFLGALIVNLLWWLLATWLHSPTLLGPLEVYSNISSAWDGALPMHLLASFKRILWGLVIALAGALIFTFVGLRYKKLAKVVDSLVYFSYPIPKLALLPVVMILLGLGNASKVLMIVLIIFFQLFINLRDSIRNIDKESLMTLRSMGASAWQRFRHQLWPAIVPDLLSSLRVAIGTSISVLFVTETYGTDEGMGYYIVSAWMRFDYLAMYTGIVLLSMGGFFLFLLTDLAEAYLCRWRNTM